MHWFITRLSPRWLFYRAETPRHRDDVIPWWESRRLFYNIIVFFAGFISLVTYFIIAGLEPRLPMEETDIPGLFVCIGGCLVLVTANMCYFAGWISELIIHLVFRRWTRLFGPVAFGAGLTFSVGVMWLPTVTIAFRWLHLLIHGFRAWE